MSRLNFDAFGLKVGLEIHAQLDTRRKLFCSCPTRLTPQIKKQPFIRYLRPARSEVGEVDPAALLEWKRSRAYLYYAPSESSCLVEADEEPPHEIDEESVLISLAVAKALNMNIVDEVHIMRKIVIDGSNVGGFQRTTLIALGGYIEVEGRRIGIQSLCLEEDAARKVEERELDVLYVLDRLGIPLLEIATAPDINTPELALKTALKIGQLIRLTGKAKRGLGSIRQDLNISISGGAKVEIKGVQHLYLIPKVVEFEVLRQASLLEIRDELKKRNVDPSAIDRDLLDVTKVFEKTGSRVIKRALSQEDGVVLALRLPGFKGLLGRQIQPGRRFGTELSDYAKVWGGIEGIINTDELPAYGITSEEFRGLYSEAGADPNKDGIIIAADTRDKAEKALRAVAERAAYAPIGVPEETRASNPDGTTRYMRPRPGSARMYPETDIPPILVTQEILAKASTYVPEHPDLKYKRFTEVHGLSRELASAILNDIRLDLYEYLAEKYRQQIPCSIIASLFVNTVPALRRDGIAVDEIIEDVAEEIIRSVASGMIAKEAIPDLLIFIAKNPSANLSKAIENLGLSKLSTEQLDQMISRIIEENKERLVERKDKAFTIVMGEVMKQIRGKVDGKLVADRVKTKLREILNIST
ncbi:MAG: Glu-tRNA(Gln) amidotransferase subunit GatE [Desulfurococcaceae archaeon]